MRNFQDVAVFSVSFHHCLGYSKKLNLLTAFTDLLISALVEAIQLQQSGSCDCSGCDAIIVLDCTVVGGGATIWQGTIFNECQDRTDILLRHTQFSSGRVINVTCDNNLSISGQTISGNSSTSMYTSRLIIGLHEDLSGRTVECANESKGIIESYMISLQPGNKLAKF